MSFLSAFICNQRLQVPSVRDLSKTCRNVALCYLEPQHWRSQWEGMHLQYLSNITFEHLVKLWLLVTCSIMQTHRHSRTPWPNGRPLRRDLITWLVFDRWMLIFTQTLLPWPLQPYQIKRENHACQLLMCSWLYVQRLESWLRSRHFQWRDPWPRGAERYVDSDHDSRQSHVDCRLLDLKFSRYRRAVYNRCWIFATSSIAGARCFTLSGLSCIKCWSIACSDWRLSTDCNTNRCPRQ